MSKVDTVFCHFSYRNARGTDTAIFAVAFYKDYNGKELINYIVSKRKLWGTHRVVASLQSYENVLRVISELQGQMLEIGIEHVILVTDNSILAKYIKEESMNKKLMPYLEKAVKNYRVGGSKEIRIGVGLANIIKQEKAYKYCNEKYLKNEEVKKLEEVEMRNVRDILGI